MSNDDFLAGLPGSHKEDFITEALCWLLKHGFGDHFLDKLKTLDWRKEMPVITPPCRWTTQETHRLDSTMKRPDMVCRSNDGRRTALIFEHKVDTELAAGQLERYRRIACREFNQSAIVLITKRQSQLGQCPDCHLLWHQVYTWLSEWLDSSDAPSDFRFAARNFLHLLQKRGLGRMEKIEPHHLQAIPVARTAEARVVRLVNSAADDPSWASMSGRRPSRGRKLERTEGRCGLYLLGDGKPATWNPDLFVGVMVDGDNHGPETVNNEGPVACVVLDIDQRKHRDYRESDAYRASAEAILGLPLDDGWRVHENPNRWHPLTIYKPLAAVISDATTADDQADDFIVGVQGVAKAVLGLAEFSNLRDALAR